MGTDIENIALLRKHRMIVFGEVHGTNEVPELVSAVTYELAKEGARILMALEVLDLLNGELADFVAGTTSVDQFLAAEVFWNRPVAWQDGRSSRAMLRLLQDVREYRTRGLMIDPRGIDSVAHLAREREASMALNLRTLVANVPYDYVVVPDRPPSCTPNSAIARCRPKADGVVLPSTGAVSRPHQLPGRLLLALSTAWRLRSPRPARRQ